MFKGIREVDKRKAREIICKSKPLGSFYTKDGDNYIGIDNTTGDAWVEEFDDKGECLMWLKGDFEIGDLEEM